MPCRSATGCGLCRWDGCDDRRLASADSEQSAFIEVLSKLVSQRGVSGALRSADGLEFVSSKIRAGCSINQRRLSANPQFVFCPALRGMVLKTGGLTDPFARALSPLARRLIDAFVFGSVAAGTDTGQSDIDVAVVGEVGLFDVSPLLDVAQDALGRPIHVSVYSVPEWAAGGRRRAPGEILRKS